MEETTGSSPLFRKVDQAVFESIDKFKQSPNYSSLQDFYNGIDEEQQKVFKAFLIIALFVIPALLLAFLFFQNTQLKKDLELRNAIANNANKILGKNRSLQEAGADILSMNPIDSSSMMTSRLSTLLSTMGVDLSKIQVKDFTSTLISDGVMKSEADFAFSKVSTDELMNIFTAMIQREKFRIQQVSITRNDDTNFLEGQFHAVHFSSIPQPGEEE